MPSSSSGRYTRAVDVEMVDALSDRPRLGRGLPRELLVGERRDERVGVGGQPLELLPEVVDLGRQRKMTRGSHDSIVAAGARV